MIFLPDFVLKLLEPHPTCNLDPEKRERQAKANQQSFVVFSVYILLQILLAPLIYTLMMPFLIILLVMLAQAIIFLILCRSYQAILQIEFTVFILVFPNLITLEFHGLLFESLWIAFIIPILFLLMTQNSLLTAVAGFIQIFLFKIRFQPLLVSHLNKFGPSLFIEKLMDNMLSSFIFLLLSCLFVHGILKFNAEKLSDAKKTVENTLEQQKTFILSFSHELRNPLNSLLGNLQLVLMEAIPLETRGMIKTAKICGELLLQYINNVLDTGKFEIGNLEVTPTSTNAYELFQRVWTISNEIIKRKGLSGDIKIQKKVPPQLLLDSQRITQVLLNLIGNAVKFTEKGSITVTVQWLEFANLCEECFEPIPYDEMGEGIFEKEENTSMVSLNNQKRYLTSDYMLLNKKTNKFNVDEIVVSTENRNPGMIRIIIKDTGCGMKEDALQRLFQKFSQVSEDLTKRKIGTGLGLFITKEICKKMQGDVRVYSREKIGTTFIVCVPISSIAVPKKSTHDYSLDIVLRSLREKNKKAIIADDSPFNVDLLCSYFSKIGVQVIATARNGQDALKKYIDSLEKGVSIDIITLDIDMPKINGKMASQKIREYEQNNRKPMSNIVMISGNYDETELKQYLCSKESEKASHFLKKPILFDDFMVTIYELLS